MIRRKLKNVIKNYTECEILVREATSNETWGPSNSILSKIAELSNDDSNIVQIMPLIWKRLKDKGRKWRHVYKSLLLMVFLVTRGNILIVDHCRRNIHFIQSLETFSYTEDNVDVGARIRKRANELIQLLKDNDMLKTERQKALITDMRFSKDVVSQGSNIPIKYGNGVGSLSQGPSTGSFISTPDNKETVKLDCPVPSSSIEEDMQLQIALAESKEEAERLYKIDEMEQLTDKFKLDLAIVKNLKENCFDSEFECGLWNEEENVVTQTRNDPWSPEPEKKPIVLDPWSENVASNESLWSRGAKPVSLDPWTVETDSKVENGQKIESIYPADPWPDVRSEYAISQCEIADNTGYNPWSTANQISSNPLQRKVATHGLQEDDSVTKFLADHSHLVNIESLLPQKHNQNNPFLNDTTGHGSRNPFVIKDISAPQSALEPETKWPSNTATNNTITVDLNSQFRAMHYNPFLA